MSESFSGAPRPDAELDHGRDQRTWVAGHGGMVGSAIVRALQRRGVSEIIVRTRDELDLTDASAVRRFIATEAPDRIYLAAARVGGIHANDTYPADFIRDNLAIELNVVDAAHRAKAGRLLFLGSSCIYPRMAEQPIREEALLDGALEPTNEPYAVAKIAGIKLCESYNRQFGTDFRSVMPTNLYGPGDNFHPDNSHVVPALMQRFHHAKLQGLPRVEVWGSGRPMREFLHVDDMADACLHVMALPRSQIDRVTTLRCSHLNVGTGVDCTIRELAETIARSVGYEGDLAWDVSKPDGTPRKLLEVSRMAELGWRASIPLEAGLEQTYDWYVDSLRLGDLRSS